MPEYRYSVTSTLGPRKMTISSAIGGNGVPATARAVAWDGMRVHPPRRRPAGPGRRPRASAFSVEGIASPANGSPSKSTTTTSSSPIDS